MHMVEENNSITTLEQKEENALYNTACNWRDPYD